MKTHQHFLIHKPYGYLSQFVCESKKKKLLGELFEFPAGTGIGVSLIGRNSTQVATAGGFGLGGVADFFAAGAVQTWIMAYQGREFSQRMLFIDQFALAVPVAYWVMRDSARRGVPKPFVSGLLLVWLWPILGTWHVFKTRGSRGFATVGIFIGVYLLSFALPYFVFAFR